MPVGSFPPERLFRPLTDAREISLPVGWLSLANGRHPELRRRSSRLATVCDAPTGRVGPRLRGRRRRGPGSWLDRGCLADLCRLLVAQVHICLGRRGRPSSACERSDYENTCPESPTFHGVPPKPSIANWCNIHMLPRRASCLCRSDLGCDLLPLVILIGYLHALTLLQGTDLWCRVRTAP